VALERDSARFILTDGGLVSWVFLAQVVARWSSGYLELAKVATSTSPFISTLVKLHIK